MAYDDCGNMSAEAIQYIPTYDIVAPEVSISCPGTSAEGEPEDVCMTLVINSDNYPGETGFDFQDGDGNVLASSGLYALGLNEFEICLPAGDYTFTMYDTFGDGICCDWGDGDYTLSADGDILASGGEFGSSESTAITLSGSAGGALTTTVYLDENCDADLSPDALGYAVRVQHDWHRSGSKSPTVMVLVTMLAVKSRHLHVHADVDGDGDRPLRKQQLCFL